MSRHDEKADNINNIIGRKLYKVRLSRGLSRAKLAKKVSITHQQIAKYESGENKVSAAKLFLIAIELDVPLTSFFEDVNNDIPQDEFSTQHQKLCLQLSSNFMSIKSSKVQKSIANLVKSYTNDSEEDNN